MARGTRIEGFKEAKRLLETLAPKAANRVLRNSVTDLARDVRDDVRANAKQQFRKRSGTLFRAIVAKRRRGKPGEVAASTIITTGPGAKHDAFFWRFLEYGTSRIPARPFVRPALDEAESQSVPRFPAAVKARTLRELEKMR